MLRLPVLAADITNLTDARYFAAAYVDYMSFCMGEGSDTYVTPQQVKEIVGWVQGPDYLLQFKSRSADTAYVEWMMESTDVGGAIIGGQLDVDLVRAAEPTLVLAEMSSIDDCQLAADGLIITDPSIDWQEVVRRTPTPIFLDYAMSVEQVRGLLEYEVRPGIVLHGGREEKVGYKSYEDIDEILELLMED